MSVAAPADGLLASASPVRVCILGSTGFVGAAVLRKAGSLGLECLTPVRDDPALLKQPLGHVVYTIGLTADFRSRPFDTIEAHVCVLRRLLAEADFDSLTYISSTRVYSGNADTRESATLSVNPNDASDLYNLSKLAGEVLCLHSGRAGVKVARLSNVVGVGQGRDNFIGQLLHEGLRTGRARMRTSPSAGKDYIALEDAANLLLQIASSQRTGIFNVASGEVTTGGTILRWMDQVIGLPVDLTPDAPNLSFAPIDTTRVRREFAFSPRAFSDYFPEFLLAHREREGTHALP